MQKNAKQNKTQQNKLNKKQNNTKKITKQN